jgi:antitoxin component of MazEF toxin-antitoxin module
MIGESMKLQRHFAYKYKGKEHYKHVVTIPEGAMESLGWREGAELKDEIKGNALVLRAKPAGEDTLKELPTPKPRSITKNRARNNSTRSLSQNHE